MRMVLKDGKRKVLTLSYDDGVVQDKRLVKILDKYGIKCTFNINSGKYCPEPNDGVRGRMTKTSAIQLFKDSGHEVAIHSYSHQFLERLSAAEVIYEITEDKRNIEKDFGIIARGMAYPFGSYNDVVVDILCKCGIEYCRTTKSTESFKFPENWLTLNPTCHHNNKRLMELAGLFAEKENRWKQAEMFYLWGHSFEFDDNDNWNVIENFSEYIGNRDNIWYATNIEVYDYVAAYKRLQVSYDKSIVHNPTSVDVWFDLENETYCVKAGKTINVNQEV